MPGLDEFVTVLEEWFDPRWAESWDAVGLVCGDRGEPVERVLLAVDPVPSTVEEAIAAGAQLLITHHPLLLTGVHGVPADDRKGSLVHRMIRGGVAHFVAHTNADVARPGVSDALAELLGLADIRPLVAQDEEPLDKLVVFVPQEDAERVIDALAAAGPAGWGTTTAARGRRRGAAPSVLSPARIPRSATSAGWKKWRRPGSRWSFLDACAARSWRRCAQRIRTRSRPSTCWRWSPSRDAAAPDEWASWAARRR